MKNPVQHHIHEQRRAEAVTLLSRPEGVTLAALAEALGVSVHTARHMIHLAGEAHTVTRTLVKIDAGRTGRYFVLD